MTAREQAQEMYNENYGILISAIPSENLCQFLAKKITLNQISAIVKENHLLDNYEVEFTSLLVERIEFWQEVEKELRLL